MPLELGVRDNRATVAAAAGVGAAFAVYLAIMLVASAPTATEWDHADPILRIIPRTLTLVSIVAGGLLTALVWWRYARPGRAVLAAAGWQALLGAIAAVAIAGGVRIVVGDSLPGFVPSEESAAPGFSLSMAAGYAEEVLFRLILVPLIYFPMRRRSGRVASILVAAVVAGLAFALLHQAGPGPSSSAYFATRFLVPGAIMTVAFIVIGPSFVVTAHCTAHILIPALFH